MFKSLTISAAAGLGCLCAPAQMIDTPAIGISSAISEEDATAYVNEFIAFMNELTSALESATDLASADAAADRLNTLKLTAAGLQAKMDLVSAADPAIQQKLLPVILGAVVEHGQRVSEIIAALRANDCYGSQALRECLAELQG